MELLFATVGGNKESVIGDSHTLWREESGQEHDKGSG